MAVMTHAERITYLRIVLGSPDTNTLPDAIIEFFLTRYENSFDVDTYPETEPLVLWNAACDILQWLINKSGASGNIWSSKTEKVGDVTVQQAGSMSMLDVWQNQLDLFYKNPEYVDPRLTGSMANLIIVGGVRKDRYIDVKTNVNGLGTYTAQGPVDYNQKRVSTVNPLILED